MSRSLLSFVNVLRKFYVGGMMQPRRYKRIYIHSDLVSQYDDEELECKYETFLNRSDIDGWELRKALNDLQGMDLVPDPTVIIAALKACRRINEYALAVRYLEAVKDKCGNHVDELYPYILQEIRPTLSELGIDTPEELGYDKPELYLTDFYTYQGPKKA